MLWILVDAVAGWFIHDPNAMPRAITGLLTTPLYAPIRAVIGGFYKGPIDFSPLLVLIAISAVRKPLFNKIQLSTLTSYDAD